MGQLNKTGTKEGTKREKMERVNVEPYGPYEIDVGTKMESFVSTELFAKFDAQAWGRAKLRG